MTDRELMQEALDALTYIGDKDIYSDTIDTLRARLARPEPTCGTCEALARAVMLDQTSHDRHKREWVGLTDEEMMQIYVALKSVVGFYSVEKYARAIEAKLKDKNT